MQKRTVYPCSFCQWLAIIYLAGLWPCLSFGQAIYTNLFTGASTCPTQGNTPTLSSNATGTPLTRSTVLCELAAGAFNSKGLNNTASVNDASYIEFSVTAIASAKLTVTSLSFFREASNTAPNQLEVRYSTDNFATATSWGAAPATPTTGATTTWDFTDFSVAPGTTLTFRFYPYGTQRADLGSGLSNGTIGTFRLDNVILNGSSPLPVNLISFTGKYTQPDVLLNWVTAWEMENRGFEVQRSTNAQSFERIGFVEGKGDALSQTVYAFQDINVLPGRTYYYRLRQHDANGEGSLSTILSVITGSAEPTDNPTVFPNPNKGRFTLSGLKGRPLDSKLFALSGQEVPVDVDEIEGSKNLLIRAKTTVFAGVYYLPLPPPTVLKPAW